MKDVKLNNNIKCCSSEQVEFGNTARDIILYKKIKELAIVVENKQDKFDFIKLIQPSGNLGRDIVGKLFTNKLIELEYNGCFYSFSKADETTLTYQSLTADLNLLKIVTINIATGNYLVIEQSNEVLDEHIADQVIHVSQADRDRWNNINDGILTIQNNGTNVQTFSANQSSNVTANIIVPTKTSDLTNDSNFVISSDLAVFATKEYVDGSVASAISRVYKPQGTVTVNTLNSLSITKEMNGYVYDISGTGTLTKGSVQVTQGDNVVIIWNEDETDWKWDKLSGIVDLSNYASKKYVDDGLETKMNVFLEVASFLNLPAVGSASTFYVTVDDNKLYRWTGSTYIEVGNSKVITTNTPTKFRNYTSEVYNYPYMQSLASDGKYIFGIMSKWAEQGRDIVACSYDLNGNLIATKELNESATLEACCGLTVKDDKLIIFQNGGVEKSVTINTDGTFGANWEVYTGFKFAEINSTTPLQDVVYSKNLDRLYVKPYDGTDTVYIYANDATATTNNTLLGTFKLKIIDGVNFTRMAITDNCVFANYTSNGIIYPVIAVYTIDGEYLYTSNISYTPEEASVGIDFPAGETFDVEHSNTQGILYINDSIYFTSISFSNGYLGHKSAIIKCTLINDSKQLILGETGSTAYPGNKGKENADNIKRLQETKADITYVDNYSGKIDSISLNGTALTINSNKNVDIPVSLTTTAGGESVTINSNSLNIVTRDTDQTVTGIKTFKDEIDLQYSAGDATWKVKAAGDYSFFIQRNDSIWFNLITTQGLGLDYTFYPINIGKDLGKSTSPWNDLYLGGKLDFGTKIEGRTNTSYITTDNYDGVGIYVNGIRPINIYDNAIYLAKPLLPNTTTIDIGGTDKKFRDIYISRNLTDGTNSVTVADITSSTFNVINASDIVNNTLTQEQYNLITNGKPTLIKGVWSSYNNLILLPPRDNSTYFEYAGFDRYKTTKIVVYSDKRITTSTAAFIQLQNIDWINGKAIPGYPSNTGTFNLKQIDGTLTWTKEWYGTQAEYDALGTYDNNTIYNIIEE